MSVQSEKPSVKGYFRFVASLVGIRPGNTIGVPLLPAMTVGGGEAAVVSEESPFAASEYETAAELFGLEVVKVPGSRNYAAMVPLRAPKGKRMKSATSFAIHHRPPDLMKTFRWFGKAPVMVLIRSVTKDMEPHRSRLERARNGKPEAYSQYIDATLEWSDPSTRPPTRAREVVIWGPKGCIVPVGSEATGALGGILPKIDGDFNNVGPILHAVLRRKAVDLTPVVERPLVYAAADVDWKDSHYVLTVEAGTKHAYRFYKFIVTPENASLLMQLPVDVLLRLRRRQLSGVSKNGKVRARYIASVLVRVETTSFVGNEPDFSDIQTQLSRLGKVQLVKDADVRKAFESFVPGSLPSPQWLEHKIADAAGVLEKLTANVSHAVLGGDMCTGWVNGEETQHLIPGDGTPSLLLLGASGSGKSTLGSHYMLQQGLDCIYVQCTADEQSGPTFWAPEFGGSVKVLGADLIQDADNAVAERERLPEIESDAVHYARKLVKDYRRGHATLPLVIRPEIEGSTLYFRWVHSFLVEFTKLWKEVNRQTGINCTVMLDDLVGIPSSEADTYLDKVPAEVGNELRKFLRWYLDNCRKAGINTIMAAHAANELKEFPAGFMESFSLVIEVQRPDKATEMYKWAEIRDRIGTVLVKDLYINLPPGLEKILGRRDKSTAAMKL